jgi:hypothetical protein
MFIWAHQTISFWPTPHTGSRLGKYYTQIQEIEGAESERIKVTGKIICAIPKR